MYLLDTNVVSELRRLRPHGAVVDWMRKTDDAHIHLSAVTLGEIQAGIEITREQDPGRATVIEAWADQVADSFDILPMDARIFRIWARLMHGQAEALYEDAMIAATAAAHGLTVVTRNVRDFSPFGVATLDPFLT